MLIKNRKSWELGGRDATPQTLYQNRREILKGMGLAGLAGVASGMQPLSGAFAAGNSLAFSDGGYGTEESQTPYRDVTGYNNFYEFGTDKLDPARHAHAMTTEPWSVRVEGEVDNPGTYAVEDLVDFNKLIERVYRLRCVEAWSMVIPWVGVPLADIIKRLGPTSRAKYVQFETLARRDEMRGLRRSVLDWPYREGLRMDEAMNPLTLMAVGLYGEVLPNQNGAPMRLVVPWKYGFKSIKSIVAMRFVERQPATSWGRSAPREYGFFSNVNPGVDHPRWSQRRERRIGEFRKRKTLMFNGYGEEVAHLYAGMDLQRNF
jgi:sulfoxide reductase catalytic subunit YedY